MHAMGDILIIDDDAAIVEMMTDALQDEGYAIRWAIDGTAGLAAIAAALPDLVLLDLHMNEMTGTEVLARLPDVQPIDVPVVIMTADTLAAECITAQGMHVCLVKPFTLDDLLDCVAHSVRVRLV
jgi:DNA-binding response OmpR family regulator